MNDRLQSMLKQLRLSGLAETLDVRLQEAAGHQLSHAEFLELILQDELHVRERRLIDRRVKSAGFKELKPLDEFDWAFNPSIPRNRSSIWRPAASFANRVTPCSSARRASAKVSSPRRSATKPSARASWCCIVRSSISSATSCTMKRWAAKRKCSPSISSRTC